MAVVGNNKIVQVYDLCLQPDTKSEERMKQCGQLMSCFSAAWSPDGLRFAIASQEGQLCVWDVRSATPIFEYWMKYRTNTSKHITELWGWWGCWMYEDNRRLSVELSSTFRSGQSTHNPTTNRQTQYRDSIFLHESQLHESPPILVHHPWRTLRFGLAPPHQDSDALPSSLILQTPPEDGDVEMRSPSPPSPVVVSHGHDNPSRSPPSPGLLRVHRRRSVSQPSASDPYGPTISEPRTIRNHTRRTISDRLRQLHQNPASISTVAERGRLCRS
ncbi:hypothetical protein M422DRAFT_39745 [Sphaerobolus stellatus SS14]|uniref:DUF2415 domain-containing protein n=1 Tax=Sphaerobolus stellatus (strain SS14) TaxID=990650 RepID=A0A0C9U280_SPHS4|nr:hypothetical protein M422DRAFT_39745 [Sphaerobolus stellatus SS14]